jgi:hypothetical protein
MQAEKEVRYNCLECNSELTGLQTKYCSRSCKEKYKYTKLWIDCNTKCLYCGSNIERPRKKFCSSAHKNLYNHKIKGYVYQRKSIGSCPESFIKSLLHKKSRRSTLNKEDVIGLYYKQKGKCAISGVKMTHITNQGKIETNISIDKIDPTKGYVIDNIQLVCNRVNVLKYDRDIQNLLKWCKLIIDNQGA